MKSYIALAAAVVLAAGWLANPLLAKEPKKSAAPVKCPGGVMACVERCKAAGGQPRFCPNYCQKRC